MKKHIPNLITMGNLSCGLIATILAINNKLEYAAFFVCLGIFLDFFDGLAARLLKVQSELGVQLDSLADMVTSGVVPGFVMMSLMKSSTSDYSTYGNDWTFEGIFGGSLIPFVAFIIPLASAYRLAKFNIDDEQRDSFIGLPTPANALLILSLPLILEYQFSEMAFTIIRNQWFLIGVTILSAFLLNARIPLFALKFKTWGFKENAVRYLFILACIILLLTLKFIAIPILLILYVIISLVTPKS
ncbi:CDP-alcohol phosphatidyltransferase family protein [Spongiivirga citrea]|uniref:Phosphatidylserine synthase n=1 Tax=Spongiivirga citrea TaxID=1481457 RepID=A0A6M0CJ48_9FLAO|nr:CDP-alcohol phosphatidyltransferase family protein [Spongiivirga citrea]NER15949.1 phosphatidylserine synthase [Spongiivirga citrea]